MRRCLLVAVVLLVAGCRGDKTPITNHPPLPSEHPLGFDAMWWREVSRTDDYIVVACNCCASIDICTTVNPGMQKAERWARRVAGDLPKAVFVRVLVHDGKDAVLDYAFIATGDPRLDTRDVAFQEKTVY